MKKKQFLTLVILFVFLAFNSCNTNHPEDGSLDEVKEFVAKDKYFKSSMKSLHFIIETQPIGDVDKVFNKIVDSYKLPVKADGLSDGVYVGTSPYDAFDYKHEARIVIKDGEITEIDYNEVHKNGTDKRSDEAYNKEMSMAGTSPSIAYPAMERQLLEKQDIQDVDATSGASYSLYRFRYAITLALMKAKLETANSSGVM